MSHFPVGFMKSARITHYVCKKCGFIEQYILEQDLEKLQTRATEDRRR